MARLNEVPAPLESVDALKRRFVRQNRDLARINSNQSVRIRNLESEISRLLSENIAFRERVIHLEHEVDRVPGQIAVDDVGSVRSKLEVKLEELGYLVQELGKAHGNLSMGRKSRRQSTKQISSRKSSDQKELKNSLTLADTNRDSQNPRLPPIIEDKYFPRRTLESEELLDILDNATDMDSPELGPPPTASFDQGDPINYDPVKLPTRDKGALFDGANVQDPCNANLETRKKRRESSHCMESDPSKMSDDFHYERVRVGDASMVKSQPLKVGAKRKLNIREDDEGNEKASEQEALQLHRRRGNPIVAENGAELGDCSSRDPRILRLPGLQATKNHNTSSRREKTRQTTVSSVSKARKALGPKSVNTDPVQSPAKLKASITSNKFQDGQDQPIKKPPNRDHTIKSSSNEIKCRPCEGATSSQEPISTGQEATNQPGTPEPLAPSPHNPQSPERSAARPKLRDTPPPPDSSVDAASITGRATRRPRGSVSYAEPNLRDKMRRPTKDFVDAVGADDRLQLVQVEEVKRVGTDVEKGRIRTVTVKREDPGQDTNTAWKSLPLSCDGERPSSIGSIEPPYPSKTNFSTNSQLPASVATDRGHSDHGVLRKEDLQSSSVSGSTIAALVAGSHKARTRERDSLGQKVGEPEELFELHTGSPSKDMASHESSAPVRPSRRHSSVGKRPNPKSLGTTATDPVAKRGDQKRESMLSSTIKEEGQADGTIGAKGVKSEGRLQKSALEMNPSRAERSASRRRSMML